MSKAKVDWAFQELITSAKLDEMVLDELVHPHLALSADRTVRLPSNTTVDIDWFLFNPAKQTFDRMRLVGNDFGAPLHNQYSLDSGATFVDFGVGTDTGLLFNWENGGSGFVDNLFYWDVDISSIASTQYIGLRVRRENDGGAALITAAKMNLYMYNSEYTPF